MLAIRRALALGAHPDDVELQAGGTLAAWAGQGVHVELACFTAGEKGSPDPAADPVALAAVRLAEVQAAAAVLGAAGVHFLGAVDGELEVTMALRLAVARLVRTVRPDVVLGHDPWRRWLLHPDHRAAGLLTVDGVVAARDPLYRVPTEAPLRKSFPTNRGAPSGFPGPLRPDPSGEPAAEGPAAHRPHTVLLFGTDTPDELVEVTATIDAKLASLRAHASQIADHADLERRVRTWNAAIGAEVGLHYAEAFHTLDTRGR
ncbi:MAG TPA: PIG-L family deacetylase [Actinomycetota bacterium]|nr:PIG-L family deacetylase [Actinomycetota bacterium]